jgi:hypothetical protein
MVWTLLGQVAVAISGLLAIARRMQMESAGHSVVVAPFMGESWRAAAKSQKPGDRSQQSAGEARSQE